MATAAPPAELERKRRLSGLKFSELARLSEITYPRVWRFFNGQGQLSDDEQQRIRAVLADDGGVAVDANPSPNSKGEQAPEHSRGVSNDAA